MDNNKKNRMKINAFDIFLVLLVLCLIGTLAFRIYNGVSEDKNSYNNHYVITFACDGEYDSLIKYVKDGDAVYLRSGELLGYITFSETNKGNIPLETMPLENPDDEQQTLAEGVDEGTKKLEFVKFIGAIKMNGNAKKAAKGNYYIIGEDNIIEGAVYTVHTTEAEFTVTIVGVKEINNY